MKYLSNDLEDHPNQHKNSHKLCDEMRHPVVTRRLSIFLICRKVTLHSLNIQIFVFLWGSHDLANL